MADPPVLGEGQQIGGFENVLATYSDLLGPLPDVHPWLLTGDPNALGCAEAFAAPEATRAVASSNSPVRQASAAVGATLQAPLQTASQSDARGSACLSKPVEVPSVDTSFVPIQSRNRREAQRAAQVSQVCRSNSAGPLVCIVYDVQRRLCMRRQDTGRSQR